MIKIVRFFNFRLIYLCFFVISFANAQLRKPNIVFIFMDDMGYGDVQILNPLRSKIPTPHMDQMAREGMIFTDAHTSSSVCTPSRYSLMTGRYNWRTKKQGGVINGFAGPLIPSNRMTVASMLKEQGYNTAMIGKWHIGMKFPKGKGMKNVDWKNGIITDGPYDLGFDYFFGISASLDMPPYIYIEDNHFVGEATVIKEPHPKRAGPAHIKFEVIEVLDELSEKSVAFIEKQKKDTPFFAYLSLPSPHTPIVPTSKWQGRSGLSAYGDFMMQTDHFVGTIVKTLDKTGHTENTILFVTSDNGCSYVQANVAGMENQGHFPSAQYRGYKSDIYEGGHRVPFIVKWPLGIEQDTSSHATICLTDFMATAAELSSAELPENAGEDSVSFLPAMLGKEIKTNRKGIFHHSLKGHFAYREGKWKLAFTKSSGGFKSQKPPKGAPRGQLYNLELDPSESNNLFDSHPEIVGRLSTQAQYYIDRGRSNTGPDTLNDTKNIRLWK